MKLYSRKRSSVWSASLLLPVLMAVGCGDDGGGPTEADVVTKINDGWASYRAGDFDQALTRFNAAISSDSNNGGGYNGVGWVLLATLDGPAGDDLAEILRYFDRAVAEGFVDADAQAGRCIVFNVASEYRQAVNAGLDAIALDIEFELPGDPAIEIRDVRLALAQAYMGLGEYEAALEQAVLIDPNRDPISANSETFLDQLISRLQDLQRDLD